MNKVKFHGEPSSLCLHVDGGKFYQYIGVKASSQMCVERTEIIVMTTIILFSDVIIRTVRAERVICD